MLMRLSCKSQMLAQTQTPQPEACLPAPPQTFVVACSGRPMWSFPDPSLQAIFPTATARATPKPQRPPPDILRGMSRTLRFMSRISIRRADSTQLNQGTIDWVSASPHTLRLCCCACPRPNMQYLRFVLPAQPQFGRDKVVSSHCRVIVVFNVQSGYSATWPCWPVHSLHGGPWWVDWRWPLSCAL